MPGNINLISMPLNNTPSSNAVTYVVDDTVSYQTNLSTITGNFGNIQTEIVQTGSNLYNLIEGLSGALVQTGIDIMGYRYLQTNVTSFTANGNSFMSGSLIGTPSFGSNIIPTGGFLPGDIYCGEFCVFYQNTPFGGGNGEASLCLVVQNNFISGVTNFVSQGLPCSVFQYKLLCINSSQLLLTPVLTTLQGISLTNPFYTFGGGTTFPTGIAINPSQPCPIDIVVICPNGTTNNGPLACTGLYSFLKKL